MLASNRDFEQMSVEDVPEDVARDLVDLLFENRTQSYRDELLLVNPSPTVGAVLQEYYDSEITGSGPTTTVIHRSADPGPALIRSSSVIASGSLVN